MADSPARNVDSEDQVISEDRQQSVTMLLAAMRDGDRSAGKQLLPLVYEELRRIARFRMAGLPAGQTLQPTALVHEAFLKLFPADCGEGGSFANRAHFFGAAACAMRSILVDRARRRASLKHGGGVAPVPLDEDEAIQIEAPHTDLLALDEALTKLESTDPRSHQVVMLRYFAGLSEEQVCEVLGASPRSLFREWAYARAWLHRAMNGSDLPASTRDPHER
jgi:RNA polymerase sigma factor (TIGR02999 family)